MKSAVKNCYVSKNSAHGGQSKLMEPEYILLILLQRGIYIYMYVVFKGVRQDITAEAAAGATTAWCATFFH